MNASTIDQETPRVTPTDNGQFWDGIAAKYAARPVGDVAAFERKKEVTRELLTPASKVLEIGCGTGSLALDMASDAGHIHGLDVSSEMVRIANEKRVAKGVSNVTFKQGTLDGALAFEPGQFDSVWAYNLLHLVDDRPATLATINSLLAPGGSFVSSNVCLGGGWVPYGALIAVLRWLGKAPRVAIYDRQTALREIREAGFVDVEEVEVGAKEVVVFVIARKPG